MPLDTLSGTPSANRVPTFPATADPTPRPTYDDPTVTYDDADVTYDS